MEVFNKMWLNVKEHEYIYILVMKFEKNILFQNGRQNKFCDIAQYYPFMLISVKMARPISFFHQKMRNR